MRRIKMYQPRVAAETLPHLQKIFEQGWIGLGPETALFENELSKLPEVGGHIVGVNSGTSALRLALHVSGVQPGTSVIVPANTFISTAAVVVQHGCRVLLADIDVNTGNINVEHVRQLLQEHSDVKAVIPVHYSGIPCEIAEINMIAADRQLTVIEDCAHAIGAVHQMRYLRDYDNVRAYSFHATKMIPVGEGGCVSFPTSEMADRARLLRRLGIDSSQANWSSPYEIEEIGFKYNMNDIAAVLGRSQLSSLSERIERRREIITRYVQAFSSTNVRPVVPIRSTDKTGAFAFSVRVAANLRDQARRHLAGVGVQTDVYFKSLDSFRVGLQGNVPEARRFSQEVISLPVHDTLCDDDVDYIVDHLIGAIN